MAHHRSRFTPSFVATLVILFTANAIVGNSSDECVYTLYVQTGTVFKGGTDSKISATLSDSSGKSVWIPDLEKWGLMGPNHDYFEKGNLDIFSGRGPCIGPYICRLNLTSDGSGSHHGWFCETVELTSTSSGRYRSCEQTIFYVDQWLASDAPPYQLSVVMDGCHLNRKSSSSSSSSSSVAISHSNVFIKQKIQEKNDVVFYD